MRWLGEQCRWKASGSRRRTLLRGFCRLLVWTLEEGVVKKRKGEEKDGLRLVHMCM